MARIIFLGTAAAVASAQRDNTSLLFMDGSGEKFLIDCPGSPVAKLAKLGLDYREISNLILTHTHVDHIYGVPSLLHSQYRLGNRMNIFATQKSLLLIRGLISFHGLEDPGKFPEISFHTIPADKNKFPFFRKENTLISSFPVKHTPDSIGLKISFKNPPLTCVYSGDTAFSRTVVEEAKDADYLIHDCACPSRLTKELEEMHTSALILGEIAEEAQVKTLIPIHFLTEIDFEMEEVENEIRKNFSGNLIIPSDFDSLELKPQPS
ncbi:MAG: MBL fold metallo-hydrolase [bacterium]